MNEIEKLYKNAGIKSEWRYIVHQFCHFYEADKEDILRNKYLFKERKTARIKKAEKKYPPFTAEKQIHIIKWLSDKADYVDIHYDRYKGLFNIQTGMGGLYVCNEFEQALASRVNIIWQSLTEEERKQIKNILKE